MSLLDAHIRIFIVMIVIGADALVEVRLVDEGVHGLSRDCVDPEAHGGRHAVHEHEARQPLLPIDNDLQSYTR